jgi:hypothetical protein
MGTGQSGNRENHEYGLGLCTVQGTVIGEYSISGGYTYAGSVNSYSIINCSLTGAVMPVVIKARLMT